MDGFTRFSNDFRAEKWNEKRFIGSSAGQAPDWPTDWLTEGLRDCRTARVHIPSTDWPTQHEIPIYNLIEHRTTKATARRRQYVFGYVVEPRCKNEKRNRYFLDFFWGGSNANVHGGTPCQRSQQRRRKLACACVRSCLCVCVCASFQLYS